MAIDSAAKRRSVAGMPFFIFGPGITPDATPDAAWRRTSGWGYFGELVAGAVAAFTENRVHLRRFMGRR